MSKTLQADGEIHEDQLLSLLVNSLDEEVALALAENAEINAEDVYEDLVDTNPAKAKRATDELPEDLGDTDRQFWRERSGRR